MESTTGQAIDLPAMSEERFFQVVEELLPGLWAAHRRSGNPAFYKLLRAAEATIASRRGISVSELRSRIRPDHRPGKHKREL